MIKVRNILYVIGLFLIMLGIAMVLPFCFDLLTNFYDIHVFLFSALFTILMGVLLYLSCKPVEKLFLSVREIFLLTSLSWLFLGLFASLPFCIGSVQLSIMDAFFESMSGITTTGATVIENIDVLPLSLLVWRAELQWLGGIGIIVMALTILPFLRIGGMQLFHSEFSDKSEKVLPRVTQIATAIFSTYVLLTTMCLLLLWLSGLSFTQALCYSLSTLSTGGFAPFQDSVAPFVNQPHILIILIVFMFIGGSTLILFVRFGRGESNILLRDAQLRAYFLCLIAAFFLFFLWQWFSGQVIDFSSLLAGFFSITSVLTTTGFTLENYSIWGSFGKIFFFILMFIGGCTGSTSGGIKIFRFQVLFSVVKTHLKHLRYPHGIFIATYNKKPITESVLSSVQTFFCLYGVMFVFIAGALSLTGLDFITSISGSVAALSNIGPALGDIIGPSGNYEPLNAFAKGVIIFGMILGRLELLTFLVIFTPYFWKR